MPILNDSPTLRDENWPVIERESQRKKTEDYQPWKQVLEVSLSRLVFFLSIHGLFTVSLPFSLLSSNRPWGYRIITRRWHFPFLPSQIFVTLLWDGILVPAAEKRRNLNTNERGKTIKIWFRIIFLSPVFPLSFISILLLFQYSLLLLNSQIFMNSHGQ